MQNVLQKFELDLKIQLNKQNSGHLISCGALVMTLSGQLLPRRISTWLSWPPALGCGIWRLGAGTCVRCGHLLFWFAILISGVVISNLP